ncbi:MAG: thymidylate kinase, partial [Bacteroidales bacterium]
PFRFTEEKLKNNRQGEDRNYLMGSSDIHESSLDFQRRVREVYIDVATGDESLQVINCSDSKDYMLKPDDIFRQVMEKLKEKNILR